METNGNLVESTVVKTIKSLKKKHVAKSSNATDSQGNLEELPASDKQSQVATPDSAETNSNDNGPKLSNHRDGGMKTTQTVLLSKSIINHKTVSNSGTYERSTKNERRRQKDEAEKQRRGFNFFDLKHKTFIASFLESLLTKSKLIKEYLEEKQLSAGSVAKYISRDTHVLICKNSKCLIRTDKLGLGFTGLLDTMYKSQEINGDLKNLSKPSFLKLESFLLQKIEYKRSLDQTLQVKAEKYKAVELTLDAIKQELLYKLGNISIE